MTTGCWVQFIGRDAYCIFCLTQLTIREPHTCTALTAHAKRIGVTNATVSFDIKAAE